MWRITNKNIYKPLPAAEKTKLDGNRKSNAPEFNYIMIIFSLHKNDLKSKFTAANFDTLPARSVVYVFFAKIFCWSRMLFVLLKKRESKLSKYLIFDLGGGRVGEMKKKIFDVHLTESKRVFLSSLPTHRPQKFSPCYLRQQKKTAESTLSSRDRLIRCNLIQDAKKKCHNVFSIGLDESSGTFWKLRKSLWNSKDKM